jgi:LysM repeat protein
VNAVMGTAYASLAAAAAGSFLATVVATAVAGAVIAAVGNIVQQGLFIALGYQESFNWNAVGSAAVTGAITGAATVVGAAAKAAEIAAQAGKGAASTATYLNVATTALKVAAAASPQLMNGGKITSWTSLAAAAAGGYINSLQGAADAQALVATTDTAIKAASAAASAAQTLSTIVTYVTPWVQLAETYVRNDGNLTPTDWANAVGSTLNSVVSDGNPLTNMVNKLGVSLLVAGALSRADKDAAQSYMENAVGQEVGQYLAGQLEGYLRNQGFGTTEARAQRVYDPNRREYVDQSGNAVVLPAEGAGRYLGGAGAGGESRDTYGNPVTPVANSTGSGEGTTDVSPGLLAGSGDQNPNQVPQIETHKLKSGESFSSLAKKQLGPNATEADIQRQVYALMELNPGLDPRTLQVGQSINLIGPNSGTTISAGTLAAYGASNAEYQGYREQQAQLAKAQEVMTLQAAYANSANAVYMDMGATGLSDATAPATSSEPSLLSRFGRGLVGALESVTVEPIRQTRDIAMAGASVFYNEVVRKEGEQYWLPEMTSNTARAYESGTSQAELLLQSNPVTGVGVLSYGATTAAMEGRYGDLAEMGGGVVGGLAIGKVTSKYGGYGVRLGDIEATGPLASQAGAIKLELVTPEKPSAYSVAFETKLDPADFGTSREVHYNRANAALDTALRSDSEFAGMMNELIPGVHSSVSSVGGRTTPSGWTWEHASSSTAFGEPGVMRLVPTSQHTPGSPWWRTIHPNTGASGGYAEWAIPAGAKKN